MSYFRNVMNWLVPVQGESTMVSEVQTVQGAQEVQTVQGASTLVSEVQDADPTIVQATINKNQVWVVSLISCQERVMVPILAANSAQVGAYIRSNVPKFLIFFQRLAECLDNIHSEVDEIALRLAYKPPASGSSEDLIASVEEILMDLSDEEIVREFYGCSLNGEDSFKVCIAGPLSLLSANDAT